MDAVRAGVREAGSRVAAEPPPPPTPPTPPRRPLTDAALKPVTEAGMQTAAVPGNRAGRKRGVARKGPMRANSPPCALRPPGDKPTGEAGVNRQMAGRPSAPPCALRPVRTMKSLEARADQLKTLEAIERSFAP